MIESLRKLLAAVSLKILMIGNTPATVRLFMFTCCHKRIIASSNTNGRAHWDLTRSALRQGAQASDSEFLLLSKEMVASGRLRN